MMEFITIGIVGILFYGSIFYYDYKVYYNFKRDVVLKTIGMGASILLTILGILMYIN